jgi:hypothetical protein
MPIALAASSMATSAVWLRLALAPGVSRSAYFFCCFVGFA